MEIQNTVTGAMSALWTKVAIFLPNFVLGIVIVVVGIVVARISRRLVTVLAARAGVDRASDHSGVRGMLEATGVSVELSDIIGRTVFLFVLLLFVIAASESLGLAAVSSTINSFLHFVPKIFAAIIIAILGLVLAQVVRDAVRRTTEGFGVEDAGALSTLAYGLVILVLATVAISQLDINTGLLHVVIGITLTVAGIAVALALGLGTRRVAGDVVYGVYARDDLEPGDRIQVDEVAGEVIEVGTVMTVIALDDGRERYIPNSRLMSRSFDVLSRHDDNDE